MDWQQKIDKFPKIREAKEKYQRKGHNGMVGGENEI
jgi:hypothetical protein